MGIIWAMPVPKIRITVFRKKSDCPKRVFIRIFLLISGFSASIQDQVPAPLIPKDNGKQDGVSVPGVQPEKSPDQFPV
jgi:hypothetical protein